jgi:hypothetical protein
MITYEAEFNEDEVAGVYAISLVESPAMEGLFIALKEQKPIQFKEVDKEQRILMGLVLEPNKPIYRNQNGEEFNIVFSEETIKKLSYNFFKSNSQKNSTIEHDAKQRIEGVTFVESWLVEDSDKDKSANFGFSYPKGSWLATMKVDSEDIWNNYVKTGKVQGFSIDAMLSLKEVNFKSNINMSEVIEKNNTLLERLLIGLGLNDKPKEEVIKLGSVASADGSLVYEFDGEVPEVGANMWMTAEDGTKVPAPIGEYEVEGGAIIVVAEEGIIAEVKEVVAEEVPAEMAQPTSAPITQAEESDLEKAIKSILVKYSEQNKEQFDALKVELADTKKQLVELSAQPASKPIKATPTQSGTKLTLTQRLNNKL